MDELTFKNIVDNIANAMGSLDGEEIAELHNKICSRKIRYITDSIWKYDGETN